MKLKIKVILLALLLALELTNCDNGDERANGQMPATAKSSPSPSPTTPSKTETPLKDINNTPPTKSTGTSEPTLKERTIDKAKEAAKKLETKSDKTIPPDQDLLDEAGEAPHPEKGEKTINPPD